MSARLLVWFGVFAAPLAWVTQLVVGWEVAEADCSTEPWVLALTAAAAAVAAAGALAAFASWRRRDRVFFAQSGALASALFLALILLGGLPAASIDGCAQAATRSRGEQLYSSGCIKCHGPQGRGVPGRGPSLRGVGARSADFYLRTGYMPLRDPQATPRRSDPEYSDSEIRALVAFVASLGGGPPVPRPHPERGSLADGLRLFTEHCAGCHQVAAKGGMMPGAVAPSLAKATPVQIAEAVRVGPYLMPRFSRRAIGDRELDSIIRYVRYTKSPEDPGGWSIGRIGPVPEGIVAWLLGAAALVAVALVIGSRLRS